MKNIVATHGRYQVTEEINCYLLWCDGKAMEPFSTLECKDQAYQDIAAMAQWLHETETIPQQN